MATMSIPTGYRAVDVPAERAPEVVELDAWAFVLSQEDDVLLAQPSPLDWTRTRGIETEDGELVAVRGSYPFDAFGVPGARLPVSGLTWVGVHPGHRRRGLLRAMITEHFARSLDRGEPVSALFAAEPGIYGRFGYGLAATELRLSIPRSATLRDVPGYQDVRLRVERLDAERHGPVVHRLHAAVERPGWATRQTEALRTAHLSDPAHWRDGAESLRVVVAEVADEPQGYAFFRRKSGWDVRGPRGTVRVGEVVARTPAVARALWGLLLDLDLMATVEATVAPDDALTQLLVDLRAASPRSTDNVWVRLLDVPAALRGRSYAAPVDVVLEVTDTLLPANAGRWRLRSTDGTAEVDRTDAAADLTLDVRELGAAYLGGTSLTGAARAGLVTEHRPNALHAAAAAFGWPVAPWCSWVF